MVTAESSMLFYLFNESMTMFYFYHSDLLQLSIDLIEYFLYCTALVPKTGKMNGIGETLLCFGNIAFGNFYDL